MELENIEKLEELRKKGLITEEEFQQAKTKALGSQPPAVKDPTSMDSPSYAMLMHLTQFTSFLVPFFGWIVPLALWMVRKDDPYVDNHGKVIFNWVISSFIYFVVCFILLVIVIGAFLMVALFICSIIFTILGAINAKNGVTRNYPLAIAFFSVDPDVSPG